MDTIFEDFDVWYDDTFVDGKPFIFACRDREVTNEERWVLTALSNTEAMKVYEYLQKHLK